MYEDEQLKNLVENMQLMNKAVEKVIETLSNSEIKEEREEKKKVYTLDDFSTWDFVMFRTHSLTCGVLFLILIYSFFYCPRFRTLISYLIFIFIEAFLLKLRAYKFSIFLFLVFFLYPYCCFCCYCFFCPLKKNNFKNNFKN